MPANPLGVLLRRHRVGNHTLAWARDDLMAPETLALTSPAFADATPMPELYRGRLRGENVSPPLEWSAPPAGTRELVLLCEDPDVPFGKAGVHVLAVGITPETTSIPERGLQRSSAAPGVRLGKAALGRVGWAGPLPPRSHGSHDYVFQLFALDRQLDVGTSFGRDDVVAAMKGHVIARGRLVGTYEIR